MAKKLEIWEVVGGGDKGGIIVRTGMGVTSPQAANRLATGAIVEELEREGERMSYKVLSGGGASSPATGWITTKVGGKELVAKTEKSKAAEKAERRERDQRGNVTAAECQPPGEPTLEDIYRFVYETCPRAHGDSSWAGGTPELAIDAGQGPEMPPESGPSPGQPPWLSRLGLERVANFRDAAGTDPAGAPYRCEGGRVRRGMLFRTGQWNSASPRDLQRIRDEFQIKTYIDLRTGQTFEGGAAPCFDEDWYPPCPSGRHKDLPPRGPGDLRRVHCPFTKGLNLRPWAPEEKAAAVEGRDKLCSWWYQQLIRNKDFTDLKVQLSCTMRCILLLNWDEVLKSMQVMSDARNYPVAYGCMAGKDRTGIFGQLVLAALGVSQEDILSDYLATNHSAAHISACVQICIDMWHQELKRTKPQLYEMMVKSRQAPAEGQNTAVPEAGSEAPPWDSAQAVSAASSPANLRQSQVYHEIMRYTFHVIDTEFGGVLKYLDWIGFGSAEVAKMREILVEKDA